MLLSIAAYPFINSNHPSVSSQCSVAGFRLRITWLDQRKLPKPLKLVFTSSFLIRFRFWKVHRSHYCSMISSRHVWDGFQQFLSSPCCCNSSDASPSQDNKKNNLSKIFPCIKISFLSCMHVRPSDYTKEQSTVLKQSNKINIWFRVSILYPRTHHTSQLRL